MPPRIILLLSDVLGHCIYRLSRDIKVGDYEEHECAPILTHEEKQAARLLKRAISTSPDKATMQLATGGIVK